MKPSRRTAYKEMDYAELKHFHLAHSKFKKEPGSYARHALFTFLEETSEAET